VNDHPARKGKLVVFFCGGGSSSLPVKDVLRDSFSAPPPAVGHKSTTGSSNDSLPFPFLVNTPRVLSFCPNNDSLLSRRAHPSSPSDASRLLFFSDKYLKSFPVYDHGNLVDDEVISKSGSALLCRSSLSGISARCPHTSIYLPIYVVVL